jgi:hypothetical protein
MRVTVPPINVVHYLTSISTISVLNVVLDPSHQMVLKGAFDNLMEKVGGEKFMNISTWKIRSERLGVVIRTTLIGYNMDQPTVTSPTTPKTSQSVTGSQYRIKSSVW